MYMFAKTLEALGIASLAIALVQGIYGHISFEYYMFFGGVASFLIGLLIEKRFKK
jgi:ABC-type branched-subunit amino acid transport system permease subunit